MPRKIKKIDEKRFFWRTQNPYIKKIEFGLIKKAFQDCQGKNILEIGSGEGANLFYLKKYFTDLTGLDISQEKLAIARREIPQAKFLEGEAKKLPFQDNTFDVVLMRDVLHHLGGQNQKIMAIQGMKRVCRQEGKIVIVEPNVLNIINFFQMLLQKEEKGIRESKVKEIKKILSESGLNNFKIEYSEPLPIDRLVLHYRFGFPWLSHIFFIRFLLNLFNLLYRILIPKRFWAYLIFKAEK